MEKVLKLTYELPDLETSIKDKDITTVQAGTLEVDLSDPDCVGGALEMEETGLVLLRGDMSEATLNTSLKDLDQGTREQVEEVLGLKALNLTVLNRSTPKKVIKLNGLVLIMAREIRN